MTKKFIQRFLPDPTWIKNHQSLRFLGDWLHDPNIWHLNRRSASMAVFIGLFIAFVPLPSQMLMAAVLAVLLRVNLPLSVLLVWVSNPITMPPLFYDRRQPRPSLSLSIIVAVVKHRAGHCLAAVFAGLLCVRFISWFARQRPNPRCLALACSTPME